MYEYAQQPWRALYLAYDLPATFLVAVPLWAVTYILPFMRPRPTWSWSQAILAALTQRQLRVTSTFIGHPDLPDYRAIAPSKVSEGVWIDGVPQLITAELKDWTTVSNVKPIRIPGYWLGKKDIAPKPSTPLQAGEKVLLYLHGGGYTGLSAHPDEDLPGKISRSLVELSDNTPRALAVEYRLSSTHPLPDRHPFPTALLDALAGYNYLVNVMKYDPYDIIVVGDSAGGNLALALVRYLVENKDATDVALPGPPGGLILLSPWTDLSDSHDVPGSSSLTNDMDILDDLNQGKFVPYCKRAFLGPYGLGMASSNRYISPASLNPLVQARFKGFPRTFVTAGGAERLLDQIRTLKDKMIADMGEDQVTYYEAVDALHDCLAFSWDSGCPATLQEIRKWLA